MPGLRMPNARHPVRVPAGRVDASYRPPPRRKTPIRCSVLFDKTQVLSYNSSMAIRWTNSADKHDVAREDALHAMLNHYLYVAEFDEPRVEEAGRPDLYVGPPRQLGGDLIEVMVERIPPRDVVIFHVMIARQKFLDLLDERE